MNKKPDLIDLVSRFNITKTADSHHFPRPYLALEKHSQTLLRL